MRFEVSGLVDQPQFCASDCGNFPPPDYPRQLVFVRALDAQGRVATGYKGTVTFTNPGFGGGNGDVADSKLTKGVGIFPVLVPKLSFWVSSAPWATLCPDVPGGGGVGFYVRDTLNPSVVGCQSTIGGSYTFRLPDEFESITLPDCLTGCFNEPTNTIVIDQNLATPTIYTATDSSMTIRGETHQEQFYSQPVSVAHYSFEAGDAGGLTLCVQCTPTMPILAQRQDIELTVTSSLNFVSDPGFTYPTAELSADFVYRVCNASAADPNNNEFCIGLAKLQVALSKGFGPTCYDNNIFLAAVACIGG